MTAIALVVLVVLGWGAAPAVAAEPSITHVPVVTAPYGKAITVDATSSCSSGSSCAGTLFFRTTAKSGAQPGWSSVLFREVSRSSGSNGSNVRWTAEIPSSAASTTGVDYTLEFSDGTAVGRSPQGTTSYHVNVLSPPVLTHVPTLFAPADKPLDVDLSATCSTGRCTAKVYYRTSPDGVSPDLLTGEPDWPSATMSITQTDDLGDLGKRLNFRGRIPASVVDTKGVDYVFKVSDGETEAWWPGTTYTSVLGPAPGVRIAYHHVHVSEPTRLVHIPKLNAPYRKDIPIRAQANCTQTRTCRAKLYWRTTKTSVLDVNAAFESADMTVTKTGTLSNQDVVELNGTIPASAADTRGVDYFFSVTDGSTEAWWPGTSHIDGYVAVPGTRVAYSHIRVNDPPHIVPIPVPAAAALKPFEVRALITCATETCKPTLNYTTEKSLSLAPLEARRGYKALPMQRVGGGQTILGDTATYTTSIPAADVTTRGLAYYLHVDDGYTRAYSPGTSYFGSYLPLDGARPGEVVLPPDLQGTLGLDKVDLGLDLAYPVRVVEPPHAVTTTLTANRARPLTVTGYSNCSSPSCTATLEWQRADGSWTRRPMTAAKAAGPVPAGLPTDSTSVWKYQQVIPRADTEGQQVRFRIIADDGYTTGSTGTVTIPTVRAPFLASVSGRVFHADTGAPNDMNVKDVKVTAKQAGLDGKLGTADDLTLAQATSAEDGTYDLDNLLPGTYEIAITAASLPEAADAAAQPIRRELTLVKDDDRRGIDWALKPADSDNDGVPNLTEMAAGGSPRTGPDNDSDGLKDRDELAATGMLDLGKRDTDGNGVNDAQDDLDDDGLTNAEEVANGTELAVSDSDNDDLPDGEEVHRHHTEPDKRDTDGDKLDDGAEVRAGTNPLVRDTDGDGTLDGDDENTGVVQRDGARVAVTGTGDLAGALNITSQSATDAPPKGPGQASGVYEIHLDEQARSGFKSAKITLPYDANAVGGDPADLRLFTYDPEHHIWAPAGPGQATVDATKHTVTSTTNHFSIYAVFNIKNWNAQWTGLTATCEPLKAPPVDVAFTIDSSGSMSSTDPDGYRREGARRFVDAFRDDDRGAVIDFDGSARLITGLTNDRTALKNAINAIDDDGGTDIGAGVSTGLTELEQHSADDRVRIMILLTDGDGSYDPELTARASREHITIFTIGLGAGANDTLLREIADGTGGEYHAVRNADDLPEVFRDIQQDVNGRDFDGDGLSDCNETKGVKDATTGQLFTSDPRKKDTDGDGLTDREEAGEPSDLHDLTVFGVRLGDTIPAGTIVWSVNSDANTPTSDTDGLSDFEEAQFESNARIPDQDGDGLDDEGERDFGVDPTETDTDGDDLDDNYEALRINEGLQPAIRNQKKKTQDFILEFGRGLICFGDLGICRSDSVPYLLGKIARGTLRIEKVIEAVSKLAKGDFKGAKAAAGKLIPVLGDGARIVALIVDYCRDHPDKAAEAIAAMTGIDDLDDFAKNTALERQYGIGIYAYIRQFTPEEKIVELAGASVDLNDLAALMQTATAIYVHEAPAPVAPFGSPQTFGVDPRHPNTDKKYLDDGFRPWRDSELDLRLQTNSRPTGKTFTLSYKGNDKARRVVDAWHEKNECARESKTGFQRSSKIFDQIEKDRQLAVDGTIKASCLEWHVYPSSRSKTIGISNELWHDGLERKAQKSDDPTPLQIPHVVHMP